VISVATTSTSYVWGRPFITTAGVTIDGILMRCSRRSASGTVTVALSEDGGSTVHASVTCNATDLPDWNDVQDECYIFFKFSSPYTQLGSANACIGVMGSVSGNAAFNTASSYNPYWVFYTRRTASPANAHDDTHFIAPEVSGAGSVAYRTITMDCTTSSTQWNAIYLGYNCKLNYATDRSTYLKIVTGQSFTMEPYSEVNIASSGSPLPSSYTATFEYAGNITLSRHSKFRAYGASKSEYYCFLSSNAKAGDTTLQVDRSTGWKLADVIVIAATDGNYQHCELSSLTANASGTTLSILAICYDHNVYNPNIAIIANFSRNVVIRGVDLNNPIGFTLQYDNVLFEALWTEFYYAGGASNALFHTRQPTTSVVVLSLSYCSWRDFASDRYGIYAYNPTAYGTHGGSITHCVGYNTGRNHIYINDGEGAANWTITNCILMGNQSSSYALASIQQGSSVYFTDNYLVGGSGDGLDITFLWNDSFVGNNFVRNTISCCSRYGLYVSPNTQAQTNYGYLNNSTFSDLVLFYTGGMYFERCFSNYHFSNCSFISNNQGTYSSSVIVAYRCDNLYFEGCVFDNLSGSKGDFLLYCRNATDAMGSSGRIHFEDCEIGSTAGYASGIVKIEPASMMEEIVFRNCSIPVDDPDLEKMVVGSQHLPDLRPYFDYHSRIRFANSSLGGHWEWEPYGCRMKDSEVVYAGSYAERLTPNSADNSMESSRKMVAMVGGQTATIRVSVYHSSDYNGSPATLVLKRNPVANIAEDTVVATSLGYLRVWEVLEYNFSPTVSDVFVFVVRCNGTSGYVVVDSWGVV